MVKTIILEVLLFAILFGFQEQVLISKTVQIERRA